MRNDGAENEKNQHATKRAASLKYVINERSDAPPSFPTKDLTAYYQWRMVKFHATN